MVKKDWLNLKIKYEFITLQSIFLQMQVENYRQLIKLWFQQIELNSRLQTKHEWQAQNNLDFSSDHCSIQGEQQTWRFSSLYSLSHPQLYNASSIVFLWVKTESTTLVRPKTDIC